MRKIALVILPILTLGIIISMTALVLVNIYKPAYKVMVEGNIIGYVRDRSEFDTAYDTLKRERIISEYESNVYLKENPTFEECYVKDDIVDSINIYTNLREYIQTEYKIYNIYVKDVKEMSFNSKEEADKYMAEIKNGTKEAVNVEIKEEIINDPIDVLSNDRATAIATDLISRYKPIEERKAETTKATKSTAVSANPPSATTKAIAAGGVWPATYKMVSCYFGEDGHKGVDLANSLGTPIVAYKAGTVTFAGWSGNYGNLVIIDHGNGVITKYAHASKIYVTKGQQVEEGQTIEAMGSTGQSTGSHLHFEILVNGVHYNPLSYLK